MRARLIFISLTTGLLFFVCTASRAEFYSGNQLKDKLEKWERLDNSNAVDGSIGAGYVAGVFDVKVGVTICTPPNVTLGQVTSIVLKFLRQYPERLHLDAYLLTEVALSTTWPCKPRPSTSENAPGSGQLAPEVSAAPTPKPKPKVQVSPF